MKTCDWYDSEEGRMWEPGKRVGKQRLERHYRVQKRGLQQM